MVHKWFTGVKEITVHIWFTQLLFVGWLMAHIYLFILYIYVRWTVV